ncbi:MAG: RagB/SusD family nutrient uptake outer membrane protein, partial [Dysgonamonadaceae bacterium]|nr:RagB/SusD family nutrient uptake outer membrane protein [Dysgonamonadaceae bacterium]
KLDFARLRVDVTREQMTAELRGMRAFYYYLLCDLFGGVPIVEEVSAGAPARNTRTEVFEFIEKELKAVMNDLPIKGSGDDYGKMTQGAAQSILVKLYLNAEEWTGAARLQDCIAACDAIINSGKYQLDADWQDPFHYFNEDSKENIFVIPYDQLHATQMNYPGRFLHYAHAYTYGFTNPSSNGVCTEKSFYEKFKPNDKRINQWLVGPQYMADGITPIPCVMDMAGQSLVLDPYIKNMEEGVENSGVRNVKFKIQFGTPDYPQDNDIPVTRYADILMTKAECLLRTGNKAEALDLINTVRARCFDAGDPDRAYTDITMDEFLDERAREFSYECYRRQDLIRFGKFNDAWWDKVQTDATKKLFPIPDARVKANPNMEQNPGY